MPPAPVVTGNQGVLGHGEYRTVALFAVRDDATLARAAMVGELATHSVRVERLWPVEPSDGVVLAPSEGVVADLDGREVPLVPAASPSP